MKSWFGPLSLTHIVFLACVMPVAGCHVLGWYTDSRFAVDAKIDQPWISADAQAGAYTTRWQRGDSVGRYLEWVDSNDRPIATSEGVITKCDQLLKQHPIPGANYPSRDVVITNPQFADPVHAGDKSLPLQLTASGFPEVKVIVCLNPIVVVIGPGPIESDPDASFGGATDGRVHVLLGRGYSYGTQVPYERAALWFSPDMHQDPRPAEVVDGDTRRIRMPWGSLILHHRGTNWIVTTGR